MKSKYSNMVMPFDMLNQKKETRWMKTAALNKKHFGEDRTLWQNFLWAPETVFIGPKTAQLQTGFIVMFLPYGGLFFFCTWKLAQLFSERSVQHTITSLPSFNFLYKLPWRVRDCIKQILGYLVFLGYVDICGSALPLVVHSLWPLKFTIVRRKILLLATEI